MDNRADPTPPGLLMRRNVVAWVPAAALRRVHRDAAKRAPLETGGVVLGYWASEAAVVITRITSAGPQATHRSRSFVPDQEYDEGEIARVYRETGGMETYLGDWHSHPGQTRPRLSRKDRSTLRKIAGAEQARAAMALSMIVAGHALSWSSTIWSAQLIPCLHFWSLLMVTECEMRQFGSH